MPSSDGRPYYPAVNLALLAAFALIFGALRLLDVSPGGTVVTPWGVELPSVCRIQQQAGRPCPSCGVTRATVLAARGQWTRSREFHPAGVPIALLLLGQCLLRLAFAARPWPRLDVALGVPSALYAAWLLNSG